MRKRMLDTSDRILADDIPYDRVCGIGLEAKGPDILVTEELLGVHFLGKNFQRVR